MIRTIMMKIIRKLLLAVLFVLIGSANMWATDYMFGITVGGTRYFLAVPSSPSSSGGTCELIQITDSNSLQRCIWHCVDSKGGTTPSDIKSSGSTGSYLYVQIGSSKYWLDEADGSAPISYSSSGYDFIFNDTGLAENSSSKYYLYRNDSGKPCTSKSSSTYSGKLLTIGSYAGVSTSKTGTGKVYVKGDSSYGGDINKDTDFAVRTAGKNGTTYYINAQAVDGYYFKGWSKNNSFTDIVISATNKSGRNENAVTLNETYGSYHATFYAMYAPYWKFSASGEATNAGGGTVNASVAKSEIEASDNSSTSVSTTASFTATANQYYEFVGWTDSKSGTSPNLGTANPLTGVTITNTEPGSTATKTVYAIFKSLSYTVNFINDNASATGSMSPVTFSLGKDEKLPKNQFTYGFSVTFDANDGGTIDGQPTVTLSSSCFSRWYGNDGNYYNDEATINKTGINSLSLTTVWHKDAGNKYKAPFNPSTPVRGDRQFTGWHWKRYQDDKKADAGQTVWMYENGKTLFAHYGDPFYAKVNLSKSSGTSGTPSVDESEKYSDNKNADLVFSITAPAASEGYHFTGWTGTGVSFENAGSLSTKATVKSSTTAGSANASVYEIKANYAPNIYSIKINANGTASTERIVFNVSGPANYRISVQIGKSITLSNVPFGSYTVTADNSWSWNSTVAPASKSVSFVSTGGSQTVSADFTITSKESSKKHDERANTVTQ